MPTSNTQQQSTSAEEQIVGGLETSKEVQESEEFDATAVGDMVTTASDEGSEEKEDLKESEVRKLIYACIKIERVMCCAYCSCEVVGEIHFNVFSNSTFNAIDKLLG